jgi:hypothetical protein
MTAMAVMNITGIVITGVGPVSPAATFLAFSIATITLVSASIMTKISERGNRKSDRIVFLPS